MNEIRASERQSTRWAAPLSGVAIATCLFGNLGTMGLTGPDEPRYVWIARAMAETGDWVTPRLYGQPWFEKPVLYYWAAAVGFLLHLPAEWAARLPSAFGALAAALTIAWLAKKHYGGDVRASSSPVVLAPMLFATSVAAVGFARAATPDMLFSSAIAAAMASSATILRKRRAIRPVMTESDSAGPRRDFSALALFGAFLGIAMLAKGPAAIALACGSIAIWALATKQWRAAIRLAHPLAIGSFCVVAIPWYALCAARNPDFLHVFIWQHNFERYATPLFQHRQPFWYFGPIVLLALLPWTVLLWPVAQEGSRLWREKSWTDSPGFFFACWAVWPIVFFSFSQSKLPGYILPSIPPLVLMCAVAVRRAISEGGLRTKILALAIGATWLVLCISAAFAGPHWIQIQFIGPILVSPGLYMSLLTLAIAAVAIVASFRARPATVILLCAVSLAVAVEIASLRILPQIDAIVSARPHAEFMRNDQHPERIFTYQLSRSWVYGLAFYFRRQLPEWSPRDPAPALVLTSPRGAEEILKLKRYSGDLEQAHPGLVYVPVAPAPISR